MGIGPRRLLIKVDELENWKAEASGVLNSLNPEAVAKAFAACWAVPCAQELLAWKDSGVLGEGKLRELGDILKIVNPHNHLSLAEELVITEVLKRVVKG